jgi:Protein of unknown function (DUF4256)
MGPKKKTSTADERSRNAAVPDAAFVATLKNRFEAHTHRHVELAWKKVESLLTDRIVATLFKMEQSGGEPDVALIDAPDIVMFVDCSQQSPAGRRSLCYDREAWQARKEARPANNVLDVATSLGIELLNEAEYRALQRLEAFDTTTSSWILTPPAIRAEGGALFGDRRYNHVFAYHNGAQSYYAARGFRGKVRLSKKA